MATASASRPVESVAAATWSAERWRAKAACAAMDTALFFPDLATVEGAAAAKVAAKVCADCPVRVPCLEFALLTAQEDGVWGGLGEDERRAERRRRRQAARRAIAS